MMKMQVQLNGEVFTVESGITIAQLLQHQKLDAESVAVAVAESFVPRHAYATTPICEGQSIEIVAPMQGG